MHSPITFETLERIHRGKTGALFVAAATCGALTAGAAAEPIAALSAYAKNLGLAFQIVDDLLDVDGDADVTGKPVGIDLRDGNPSLPLVLAIAQDAEVCRVFVEPAPSSADIANALERVRKLGVLATVRRLAEEYAGSARGVLATLPYSPYRDALQGIVTEIEERRL